MTLCTTCGQPGASNVSLRAENLCTPCMYAVIDANAATREARKIVYKITWSNRATSYERALSPKGALRQANKRFQSDKSFAEFAEVLAHFDAN